MLADFALGHLTPEASMKVSRELERNPQAYRNLEFILKLIAYFEVRLKESQRPAG
jgi:hypothetical protein